jgi:hypothetical protein
MMGRCQMGVTANGSWFQAAGTAIKKTALPAPRGANYRRALQKAAYLSSRRRTGSFVMPMPNGAGLQLPG